jgi:hypothetical protein
MGISVFPQPTSTPEGASAFTSVGAETNTTAVNNVLPLPGTQSTATFLITSNVNLPVGIYTVSGLSGVGSVSLGDSNLATADSNVFNVTTAATSFYFFAPSIWATGNSISQGNTTYNYALSYGNGKYISVQEGGGSGQARWSTNGITWTSTTNHPNSRAANNESSRTLRYLNSIWFFCHQNTGDSRILSTSTDGLTWTSRTMPVPTSSTLFDVAYGNSVYVAVGYMPSGANVFWSTTGTTPWTTRAILITTGTQVNTVTYGPSGFLAVPNNARSVYASTDGITWATRSITIDGYNGIYANSQYMVIGSSLETLVSTDTITWTVKSTTVVGGGGAGANYPNQLTYGDGYYIAAGGNATNVHVSTDGSNWTLKTVGVANPASVVYGTEWVTVANAFRSATSPNASGTVQNAQGVILERKGTVNQTI